MRLFPSPARHPQATDRVITFNHRAHASMLPAVLQAARIVSPIQGINHGIETGSDQLAYMFSPTLCGFHNDLDISAMKERSVRVGGSSCLVRYIGAELLPFSDMAHRSHKALRLFRTLRAGDGPRRKLTQRVPQGAIHAVLATKLRYEPLDHVGYDRWLSTINTSSDGTDGESAHDVIFV
jgi:hypothetical protein